MNLQKLWPGNWFRNNTLKEPEWWRQMLSPMQSASGASVTLDTAVRVSAVWACVRIISESIASLPLNVYERRNDGGKDLANRHPLFMLLHALPNNEQTSFELIESTLSSILLRGTAYNQVMRSRRGQVGEIRILFTKYMRPDRSADGTLIFDYQEPGNERVFTANDIWRVSSLGHDGVTGLSVLSLGRESIGVAVASEQQAAKLYSNGMQVPAVFEIDSTLKDEQYERLKKELNEKYAGSQNAYKTLVLESGLKYKQIGITAEDSQFLESRKFQIAEIARWFRVPMHMLNELDKATFSNIEHQSLEFVIHTLRPWIRRLELSMLRDLFTEAERARFYAEFKIDALLRGDTKTRYEAYGKAITDGWLSRNEVRGFENLNPQEGLDEYLVPLNMAPTNGEDMDTAQNLVRKEIKAISVEYDKRDPDGFKVWADDFYHRFQGVLINHGVSTDCAEMYAQAHCAIVKHADDVHAVMKRWERTAPMELAA